MNTIDIINGNDHQQKDIGYGNLLNKINKLLHIFLKVW